MSERSLDTAGLVVFFSAGRVGAAEAVALGIRPVLRDPHPRQSR